MYACNVKLHIVHSMYLSFHKLIIRLLLAFLSLVSILCVRFIFNTENNLKKNLGNGNCWFYLLSIYSIFVSCFPSMKDRVVK